VEIFDGKYLWAVLLRGP